MSALEDLTGSGTRQVSEMSDERIRSQIETLLKNGLDTETMPRADTHEQVLEITKRLHESDGSLESKLVISGFTLDKIDHGGIEQECQTCMYYLVHRKYCELPELDLPVEPKWSCRLWRI